jgi:hypothetical protein
MEYWSVGFGKSFRVARYALRVLHFKISYYISTRNPERETRNISIPVLQVLAVSIPIP